MMVWNMKVWCYFVVSGSECLGYDKMVCCVLDGGVFLVGIFVYVVVILDRDVVGKDEKV